MSIQRGNDSASVYGADQRRDIAIVGSGIAGMSAAWLLNQRHDVTVYEQNDYFGGHSNTASVTIDGHEVEVDTGFIVYNPSNYPNLVALFDHLDVPTKISDMSFAASLDNGSLEYSGTDLNGLFAQRRNLARPRFLSMLKDLLRFYRQAPTLTDDEELRDLSLGDFLRRERYGEPFIRDHLMPMGAAIWSSSIEQMLTFPTLAFLRFFRNHGLVQLRDRPEWRTVDGGSKEYVARLTRPLASRIQCNAGVQKILRDPSGVTVVTADSRRRHDHVVLACHADQALRLLDRPDRAETAALGRIRYQSNHTVLHTDVGLMPRRRRAWASWNYMSSATGGDGQALCVTYWMNLLQTLETSAPLFVTLNPHREIDAGKVLRTYDYEHPIFDAAALRAQSELWALQGRQNTWFCGAYFGSGFHEDGIQAGLAVAERLGGQERPWTVADPSARVGLPADWNRAPRNPRKAA
ncbi:MAG: FAD-dependent oxidoreductase [Gammaproteobacteria bacterium]|nr:FAD-dependent oxidoreductase [Gammaproteobacteria bacterium]